MKFPKVTFEQEMNKKTTFFFKKTFVFFFFFCTNWKEKKKINRYD